MAFVFDATTGGTATNSYSTVEDADDYFDGRHVNELWTALDTNGKQRYLVRSSRRLDAERWSGRSQTLVPSQQALQWPRDFTFDRDGYPYDGAIIPVNLRYAVYELAYFFLERDERIMDEPELHDAEMMDGFKIGPLDYKFNAKARMDRLPHRCITELRAIGPGVWLGEASATVMFR